MLLLPTRGRMTQSRRAARKWCAFRETKAKETSVTDIERCVPFLFFKKKKKKERRPDDRIKIIPRVNSNNSSDPET